MTCGMTGDELVSGIYQARATFYDDGLESKSPLVSH